MRRRSARNSAASSARAGPAVPGGSARVQDAGGLRRGDLLADAAGHQLAQHRVQPAGDLVAGPAQVPVPLSPHLQHCRVVLGPHQRAGRRPQRRDRDRPGVVRVVLVHRPGAQQPHPRGQLGLHVQHPLTRRDQLLGQQLLRLHGRGPNPYLAQWYLIRAERHRRMRTLVRVHPDHHCRHRLPLSSRAPAGPVAGMPNSGSISGRTSFEPRHGKGPTGWHIVIKPGQAAGRRFGSQPIGPLNATDNAAAHPENN
jgi:hypothetical protein